MEKKIIYLDQNFISDIAKLTIDRKKDKISPTLKGVYTAMKLGVDEEKFLSPNSSIHALETALESYEDVRSEIQSHQGYLGQVKFRSLDEIRDSQFFAALVHYYGKEWHRSDIEIAFVDNPDKRLERIAVTVRRSIDYYRNQPPVDTQELLRIKEDVADEQSQYQEEIDAARRHYIAEMPHYLKILKENGITNEEASAFIASPQFAEIPSINIYARMWSKNFVQPRKEEQLAHDLNDISFLAAYLPYCDIIGTDKRMKQLVEELKLDQKYKCSLYSLKETNLKEMQNHLEQLREGTSPATNSLFSVVCTKPTTQNMYDMDFLKLLNAAHNTYTRTGKHYDKEVYVSIFVTFADTDHTPEPEPVDGYWQLTQEQWADMLITGFNFNELILKGTLEETIATIPDYLRGKGTAVIDSQIFMESDYDSRLLFDDIEKAIESNNDVTERYKIKIVYPK